MKFLNFIKNLLKSESKTEVNSFEAPVKIETIIEEPVLETKTESEITESFVVVSDEKEVISEVTDKAEVVEPTKKVTKNRKPKSDKSTQTAKEIKSKAKKSESSVDKKKSPKKTKKS